MNRRPAQDNERDASQPKRLRTWDTTSNRVLPIDHHVPPLVPQLTPNEYTIAWICALPLELKASRAMLDEEHPSLPSHPGDINTYVLGRISQHNIVMACLPGQYGTNTAAIVATNLKRSFPAIRAILMVGIGGGAPTENLYLGDVVVGMRVTQYDMGKDVGAGDFQITADPTIPSPLLLSAVSTLRATPTQGALSARITALMQTRLSSYTRPSQPDQLFQASYEHPSDMPTCDGCDLNMLEVRRVRASNEPKIHYGGIASANTLMRNARARDDIAYKLSVLCFEMESAGMMDNQCLPIRGICDYSDSHKNKVWQDYAAATAAAYARELLEVLPSTVRELAPAKPWSCMASKPGAVTDGHLSERRQRLLKSLSFSQIEDRKTTIRAAHTKTCQWFLLHSRYQNWLDPRKQSQNRGFLWIVGKAGAGKSTLMKFVYLETKKSKGPGTAVASFFFNARGDYLERSIAGMYRSLLLQLLKIYPELQAVLDDTDIVPSMQRDCPSLNVLKELLRSAIMALRPQRAFACFIDALDECDELEVRDAIQFFEELTEATTEIGIQFRVCFSSRPYPYIHIRPEVLLILEDEAGHAEDLAEYVQNRLRITSLSRLPELQAQILERSSGIFIWIVLVVEILNKESEDGALALKKRLEEIPTELSDLFKSILTRDQHQLDRLLLCILWVLCAKRPLSPTEFRHALWVGLLKQGLVDPSLPENTHTDAVALVTSSSKGLAEITKSTQPKVQFIHESVRDFLVKENGLRGLWPDIGFEWEAQAHEKLRYCCSTYLSLPEMQWIFQKPEDKDQQDKMDQQNALIGGYPFLEYASQQVLYHADAAAAVVPQDGFLFRFFTSAGIQAINRFEKFKNRRYNLDTPPLYILADKGLGNLIRAQMKREVATYITDERYEHPFFAALASGHNEAVAAVLGLPSVICDGVDITQGLKHRKDMPKSGYTGRTPLSWAAQEGRLGLVKALTEGGAPMDEMDRGGRTPLLRALSNAHEDVARLLIEKGADVDARDDDGGTALMYASDVTSETMAWLLMEKGADVDARDHYESTALMFASWTGSKAVARLLIEKGSADIHLQDAEGRTALMLASSRGYEATARLLIEKGGADMHARDMSGCTALMWASSAGKEAVVRLLIEKGADVHVWSNDKSTALSRALSNKHEAVARLLRRSAGEQ